MVTITDDWAEFAFFRPQAESVYLIGDFNGWRFDELAMVRNGDGYWSLKLRLPPGEFKFRYYADGQWFTDYAAFGVEPGPFGLDSLVRIPPRPLTMPAPAAAKTKRTAA